MSEQTSGEPARAPDAAPPPPPEPRTIYAHLFAESTWSRMYALQRRERGRKAPSPLDPRLQPNESVLHRLSALGTLLRVVAREGDRLWLPKRIDLERIREVPGLARPEIFSGARHAPAKDDVSWADSTDIACAVNDRRFCRGIQERLGCTLAGSSSADWIDDAISGVRTAAAATAEGAWVVKAIHSSAARGRVMGRGPEPDDAHRKGIAKLVDLHGAVIIEPWVPRLADFGACAEATAAGATDITFHDLESNNRGDFRGVTIPSSLRPDEEQAFRESVAAVGLALAQHGYRGPFGLDAFRWKGAEGQDRFHPLCEINARWTFGRVARELASRLEPPRVPLRLRVGTAAELDAARAKAAEDLLVLLAPGPPDDVAAWVVGGRSPSAG